MSNAEQLAALLDGTLDDVADMPEFVNPNPGTWLVEVKKFSIEEINKQHVPKISLVFTELIEANDPAVEPQTLPIEANAAFFLYNEDGSANEFGQGNFKMFLAPLKEITGAGSNREVMEASVGAQLIVTTGLREDKKEKGKFYLQFKNVMAAS